MEMDEWRWRGDAWEIHGRCGTRLSRQEAMHAGEMQRRSHAEARAHLYLAALSFAFELSCSVVSCPRHHATASTATSATHTVSARTQ